MIVLENNISGKIQNEMLMPMDFLPNQGGIRDVLTSLHLYGIVVVNRSTSPSRKLNALRPCVWKVYALAYHTF